jgi:hypothetical protein
MPQYIPELGKTIPVKEPIAIFAPFWRTNSTNWIYLMDWSVQEAGRYIISLYVFTENSSYPCYVEILKNYSVVSGLTTYSTTPVFLSTFPKSFAYGDTLSVRFRSGNSAAYVDCGSILVTRISE